MPGTIMRTLIVRISAVDGPREMKFKNGGADYVTNVLVQCGDTMEDELQLTAWGKASQLLGQLIEGNVNFPPFFFN
jgi:hypothetical protein